MEPKKALLTVKQVCEMYKGTLEEHKILQTSISILDNLVKEHNDDKPYEEKEREESSSE